MPFSYDLTGETLDGRYEITGLLGKGGMGHVYAAEHIALEQRVAIKVLHPRFAHERRFRDRFMQEARSASKIQHRNVVDIKDFGHTPDGSVYFAMEFLRGHDIGEELKEVDAMSWPRVRHILLQAASALQAAHESGIIHRDIKPGNCFLTREREDQSTDCVKLLDFGIAKVYGDSRRSAEGVDLTGTGEVLGTATYMSPEQARGEGLDPRTDIYSLGIMTYQMLTGRVPFIGVNALHVISRHLTDRPRSLRAHRPSISREVDALVLKALAKERDDRFDSMAGLRAAVEATPGALVASGKRKTQLWGGGGVGVSVASASACSKRAEREEERSKSRVERRAGVRTEEPVNGPRVIVPSTPVSPPEPSPPGDADAWRSSRSPLALRAAAGSVGQPEHPVSSAAGTISVAVSSAGALDRRRETHGVEPTYAVGGAPGYPPAPVWTPGSTSTGPSIEVGDAAAETRPHGLEPAEVPNISGATVLVVGLLFMLVAGGSALGTLVLLSDGRSAGPRLDEATIRRVLQTLISRGRSELETGRTRAEERRRTAEIGAAAEPNRRETNRAALEAASPRHEVFSDPVDEDDLVILDVTVAGTSATQDALAGFRRPAHETQECQTARHQAQTALEACRWGALRGSASQRTCWSAAAQTMRLRLHVRSLLELREFEACVRAGRRSTDSRVEMMVSECERKMP